MKKLLFFTILLCSIMTMPLFLVKEADLFKAVEANNLSLVKQLVKTGEPLNKLNTDKKTVLDIATERQFKRIARYLLQHGAKVTTEDNALLLKKYLERRALGFFMCGWFFMPLLWIGSIFALSNISLVQVL